VGADQQRPYVSGAAGNPAADHHRGPKPDHALDPCLRATPRLVSGTGPLTYEPFEAHVVDHIEHAPPTHPIARPAPPGDSRSSLLVGTAFAQHGQGDGTAPDGFIGQTDPALTLGGDVELVVQVLQVLFDGGLGHE
jgi:hypothetical protein